MGTLARLFWEKMNKFIVQELEKIREQNLWRELQILEGSRCNKICIDGEQYLNFSSNDYLGYAHHPKVIEEGRKALEKYGAGGRSSRLISGTLDIHAELESELARFKQTESALLFPSGFMANLAVLSTLLGEGDAVIMDRLNHASLIDAAKLSRARVFVYEHCSVESLERVLMRTRSYKKRLVVTDSLFSMDGDVAPLREISKLCKSQGVWLMIDDAHATGILGEKGIGLAEECGVLGQVEIVMGTLSKALGSQGGFVCGSKALVQLLVNRARTFIYTTALSPVSCAAALEALNLIKKESQKRKYLLDLSRTLREKLNQLSNQEILSQSQILPFMVGSTKNALKISAHLRVKKIYAPAIRPPTVPKNECRLRFSVTSEHTHADIQRLVGEIRDGALFAQQIGLRP